MKFKTVGRSSETDAQTRNAVLEECFGKDSEDEFDVGEQCKLFFSHMETLEWSEDKGRIMKLFAEWEAQGCDGAMSNSGQTPTEVAMDQSLADKEESDYQNVFLQHTRELFANDSTMSLFNEHADQMPDTFLQAVSMYRGPNHWAGPTSK